MEMIRFRKVGTNSKECLKMRKGGRLGVWEDMVGNSSP